LHPHKENGMRLVFIYSNSDFFDFIFSNQRNGSEAGNWSFNQAITKTVHALAVSPE